MRIAAFMASAFFALAAASVSAEDHSHSGLREETRAVLPHLKNGHIVEEPGLTHGMFDVGAPIFGRHRCTFFDTDL